MDVDKEGVINDSLCELSLLKKKNNNAQFFFAD